MHPVYAARRLHRMLTAEEKARIRVLRIEDTLMRATDRLEELKKEREDFELEHFGRPTQADEDALIADEIHAA